MTCKCLNCGQDFYAEEPQQGFGEGALSDDGVIYDENELRAAEEDLKGQADQEDDRRYKPY